MSVEKLEKKYHKKRRIFAIINNKLKIAKKGYDGSHDEWFVNEGWITGESDPLYEEITRGMLDPEGNLYFYVGKDLRLTEKAKKEFFSILGDLVRELEVKENSKIGENMIRGRKGIQWPERKSFGEVKDFL